MHQPSYEYQKLLRELQAVEFALVELTLYLDTHPRDRRAIGDFNYLAHQLHCLKAEYESKYGPLLQYGFSTVTEPFSWMETPWPWEIEYDSVPLPPLSRGAEA